MTDMARPFPFEAVIHLVQVCRNDERLNGGDLNASLRQRMVAKLVGEVAETYEINPKQLSLVAAQMMSNVTVPADLLCAPIETPAPGARA